jgi:hypothetical protein
LQSIGASIASVLSVFRSLSLSRFGFSVLSRPLPVGKFDPFDPSLTGLSPSIIRLVDKVPQASFKLRSSSHKVLKVPFDLQDPLQPRFFVEKLETPKLRSRSTVRSTASSRSIVQGHHILLERPLARSASIFGRSSVSDRFDASVRTSAYSAYSEGRPSAAGVSVQVGRLDLSSRLSSARPSPV